MPVGTISLRATAPFPAHGPSSFPLKYMAYIPWMWKLQSVFLNRWMVTIVTHQQY